MKVFILEDIVFRQNYIKKLIGFEDVDCAQRADDGLALLSKNDYDLVFLDHDLLDAKSGSYLTMNWVQSSKAIQTQKPLVIIHSMNMVGADKMERHLKGIARRIERIPFKLIVEKKVDLMEIITNE